MGIDVQFLINKFNADKMEAEKYKELQMKSYHSSNVNSRAKLKTEPDELLIQDDEVEVP